MNSGRPSLTADSGVVELRHAQDRILKAWMLDGADYETVARRVGRNRNTVVGTLTSIRRAFDFDTLTQLALALSRGQVSVVVSNGRGEMPRDPARSREGA